MRFLLSSVVLATLFFTGCGEQQEQKKVEVKPEVKVEQKQESTKIQEVANNLKATTNDAIDVAAKMAEELSKESDKMVQKIQEESKVVVKEVAKQTKELSAVAVEKVNEVKKELDTQIDQVIQEKQNEVLENSAAKDLYLKCAGCHGQKAERAALNKSEIIQGWEVQRTIDVLNGYKNGSYGGTMKSLMTGQVANLSDEEIKLLSEYIFQLK